MWTLLTGWFVKNQTKFIEYGVMAIMAGAILFAIWLGAHQRVTLAEKVGSLETAQTVANDKLAQQQSEISRLNALNAAQAADMQTLLTGARDLDERLTTIRTETDRRLDVINRHDLSVIGSKKPTLLENRINKATRDEIRRLQDLTK